MKNLLFLAMLLFVSSLATAQTASDTTKTKSKKLYVVVKNDGTEYVGFIISQDAREVLLESTTIGQVFIPKHEIKEIRELKDNEFKNGKFVSADLFATRYFITTNGLPIKKGDSYVQWSLWGPDFQFGVGEKFGMGIMTSWVGVPIVVNAKYSFKLSDNVHFGLGALVGTASWASISTGGALPFGSLTFGNGVRNLTLSGGYGAIFSDGSSSGRALFSVAGMAKVGKKISLILDSFIFPTNINNSNVGSLALLCPGIRWHTKKDNAFQFGFLGVAYDSDILPLPIPMVQWFVKL